MGIGNLAIGQTVTLTLTGTLQVSGPVTNLVVRTSQNEPDPNPANDSAAAPINSWLVRRHRRRHAVVPPNPAPGGAVTFTVVVTNHGPFDAPAVTVDDAVPAGAALVSAIPSVGTYSLADNRWTIGAMAVGATATLTMETTAIGSGVILQPRRGQRRRPAGSQPAQRPRFGPRLRGSDSGRYRPPTCASPRWRCARWSASSSRRVPHHGDQRRAAPGAEREFARSGAGWSGVHHAQWSQGTIDVATSRWLAGPLQPTQSATLRLTATVTAAGTVVNTAAIVSTGVIEVDLTDNISSAIVITPEPITPQCADVELTQTYSPFAMPGGTVTFTYTATNRGPAYARDLVITDMAMPPAGVTLESLTPSAGGSCMVADGAIKCMWPGDTLIGDGAARRLEVVYRVNSTTPPGRASGPGSG